jgi:hypothetical protein
MALDVVDQVIDGFEQFCVTPVLALKLNQQR